MQLISLTYFNYDFLLNSSQKKLKHHFIDFKKRLTKIVNEKLEVIKNSTKYTPTCILDIILLDYLNN